MHPKAFEAQQAAAKRAAERAGMKQAVTKARNAGIRFYQDHNLTVAYSVDVSDVIYLATAIRNPTDKNDPLLGKFAALKRFVAGHVVTLRKARELPVKEFFTAIAAFCS